MEEYRDEYTEVTEIGFGESLTSSFSQMGIGGILFLISLFVLWWNEGRVDLSTIAKKSIPLSKEVENLTAEGKLVSLSGTLEADEEVKAELLKGKGFLILSRRVEMYAWKEEEETTTEKQLGGGERRITRYRYVKEWTEQPEDSSLFHAYRKGVRKYENPPLPLSSKKFSVSQAKIGPYSISSFSSLEHRHLSPLSLTQEMLTEKGKEYKIVSGGKYLFKGKGSIHSPEIGDLRISFQGLKKGTPVTVFGKLQQGQILPYEGKGGKLFHLFANRSRTEAIEELHQEYIKTLWGLRLLGFLFLWVGLQLFFSPLFALLDVLPLLGRVARGITALLTFFIALVLSLAIILLSKLFHSLLGPLVLAAAILGGGYLLWRKRAAQPRQAKS